MTPVKLSMFLWRRSRYSILLTAQSYQLSFSLTTRVSMKTRSFAKQLHLLRHHVRQRIVETEFHKVRFGSFVGMYVPLFSEEYLHFTRALNRVRESVNHTFIDCNLSVNSFHALRKRIDGPRHFWRW